MESPRPAPLDPTRKRRILTQSGRIVRPPQISDPELDALRAEDAARDAAFHPLNAEGKRRLAMYVLGAMVFFPLATWFLTPAGFSALGFQLLLAAAYGCFVALARPAMVLCALTTTLAGFAVQAVAGATGGGPAGFLLVLSCFFYGTAGLLVGFTEHGRQLDR